LVNLLSIFVGNGQLSVHSSFILVFVGHFIRSIRGASHFRFDRRLFACFSGFLGFFGSFLGALLTYFARYISSAHGLARVIAQHGIHRSSHRRLHYSIRSEYVPSWSRITIQRELLGVYVIRYVVIASPHLAKPRLAMMVHNSNELSAGEGHGVARIHPKYGPQIDRGLNP
jgi:hypothetical protein